jgi:hypothetical protein
VPSSDESSTYILPTLGEQSRGSSSIREERHGDDVDSGVEPATRSTDFADHAVSPLARAHALYILWTKKGNIPVERPPKDLPVHKSTALLSGGQDRSDKIYEDLLDLFIYAQHHRVSPDFEQAVFRKWQESDFPRSRAPSCPDLEIINKAFNTLPAHHFMLKHLVRLMGSLWSTDNEHFIDEYEPRGAGFERFLYGICWHR